MTSLAASYTIFQVTIIVCLMQFMALDRHKVTWSVRLFERVSIAVDSDRTFWQSLFAKQTR